MNIHVISLAALVLASSCQTRQRVSPQRNVLKESPQTLSQPEALGLSEAPSWRLLKGKMTGGVTRPWTDAAWTIADHGLAHRWRLARDSRGAGISADPLTLFQQVSEMQDALAKKDVDATALLSPAEKYDIVATGGAIPPERLAALKAAHGKFESHVAKEFQEKRARLSQLQDDIRKTDERIQALGAQRRELTIEREKARRGAPTRWSEDLVMPLSEKVAALREAEKRQADLMTQSANVANEIKLLLQPVQEVLLEETKALKPYLPMTAQSWEQWLTYATNRYDDGRRLGHQQGWAPASLRHLAPRHGVLAKKGDVTVHFTEGDIRGLLSKLYAEQGPREAALFAARCKGGGVAQQQRAALTDGMLCVGRKSGSCSRDNGGRVIHVKNNRIEDGLLTFAEATWNDESKVGVVQSDLGQDYYAMNVFASSAAFEAWFQSGGQNGHFEEALLHLTKGCRDTTPLAFHLALTKLIADGTGVVLEETRSGLTWRQPAYRYELTYIPIILNKKDPAGKTLSKPDEPSAVGDIADVFRAYRAPRTAFLQQVQATLYYAKEGASRVTYGNASREFDGSMVVTYTLELDVDKRPIGGQWGLIPTPDRSDARSENDLITGEGPDLLWYYSKEGLFDPGPYDSELIMKLYDCSREGPTVAVSARERDGENVSVQARMCKL